MPTPVAAEGMRDVGEAALLVNVLDRRLRGQSGTDLLLQKETNELAIRRRDLLADDDLKTSVHLAQAQSTLDRVVVRDADRAQLRLASERGELAQSDAAVARILRVHVHVEADAIGHGAGPARAVPDGRRQRILETT